MNYDLNRNDYKEIATMNTEQKAKAYDEALERARKIHSEQKAQPFDIMLKVFPELKESEDERIRKHIIKVLKHLAPCHWDGDEGKECIAWLEKKDEQRTTDKVEPKFKVGDWVVSKFDRKSRQISEVHCDEYNNYYIVNGNEYNIEEYDRLHHLWTIQDAKDGDVLACESGWTCIFKTLVNDETFSSYCFMDKTKWFCEIGSECHTLNKEFMKAYNGEIKPATKEQRDQLEKAVFDAGYKWNKEELKLEKI